MIRKSILSILFLLSLALLVCAQISDVSPVNGNASVNIAKKIDEMGDISKEELAKNLVSIREQNGDAELLVIYFAGFNEPPFRQTIYYTRNKTQEIDGFLFGYFRSKRVSAEFGGLRDRRKYEIWAIPRGAEKPEYAGETEIPRELLYRFELLETQPLEFEKKLPEKYELENRIDFEDLLRVAGKVLRKDSGRRAVLFYYLNDSTDDVQKSRESVERFIWANAEKNKLDPGRVTIIFGGYRRVSEIESWAIPRNEPDPDPLPETTFEKVMEN